MSPYFADTEGYRSAIGEKVGFIFTIRHARKASREAAVTGKSVTRLRADTWSAWCPLLYSLFHSRDSERSLFSRWYPIPKLSCPSNTMRPVGIFSFIICFTAFIRASHNTSSVREGRANALRPSTISSFWTRWLYDVSLNRVKGRVRASSTLNFMSTLTSRGERNALINRPRIFALQRSARASLAIFNRVPIRVIILRNRK